MGSRDFGIIRRFERGGGYVVGVPRNTILILPLVELSEEEEYRLANDLAWWKRRGSTAIEDVDAWCRLYLANADGLIRTPRVPNWKP